MKLTLGAVLLLALMAPYSSISHAQSATEIGGEKIITLTRKAVSTTRPEFTSVSILPGRGMELLQVKANFPGKGEVDVLASPDEATAKQMLDQKDTDFGDLGYRLGAAFLVPYPNRIRGKLSADGKTLTTEWNGHTITLPANNIGKNPGAERHAMHGLILKAKAENLKVTGIAGGQELTGIIHAGDFGGHWPSKTDLNFTIALHADAVDATVVAQNVGKEATPISIGWHPYFNLPSGDRTQVRIHIPGEQLAEVDNYDNVFPTGKLKPVTGTQYDLRDPNGVPLAKNFYDDNWSKLDWKNNAVTVKVIDPAAKYGVAIEGLSPQIKTIQMYAPPTQKFVAIEHQFNFADPFGKEWNGMDTGMITLKPGQSTKWHVRLKVFVP
ncbi:aldose 1-epimerase [Occallatibacter riparius]|uniref:Aldose 1-epimerase n=1 Tax=Occallatibacter riparius TaxID=1002689 RepID=A0A9J7BMK9_9BACT|nr:aldose 1-epimerase [Occallatibacter riparius]UWZ83729.1 aldose 1-epimerase [Occallatibacter riparius]